MLGAGKLRSFGFEDFFDQIEVEDFRIHIINYRLALFYERMIPNLQYYSCF